MGEAINSLQRRVKNEFWEVMIYWLEALGDHPKTGKFVNFGQRVRQQIFNQSPIKFYMIVCSLGLSIGLGIGAVLAFIF